MKYAPAHAVSRARARDRLQFGYALVLAAGIVCALDGALGGSLALVRAIRAPAVHLPAAPPSIARTALSRDELDDRSRIHYDRTWL